MSQREPIRQTPVSSYRKLIRSVFDTIRTKSNETINRVTPENTTVLMSHESFDFLKFYTSPERQTNLKEVVRKLWCEKAHDVIYHSEDDMFKWFDSSLKAPHVKRCIDLVLEHTTHEKPVLLIHTSFDVAHIYYLYGDEIKLEMRYQGGTSKFMEDKEEEKEDDDGRGQYPKLLMMIKDIVEKYPDASILLNISGLALNSPGAEFFVEKITPSLKDICSPDSTRKIISAELDEQLSLSCFTEFNDYLFYRFLHKMFRENFPERMVMMNSCDHIPIVLNRTGYLYKDTSTTTSTSVSTSASTTTLTENKLCIIDDWDVVYVYFMNTEGKTILIHLIHKGMMEFVNLLEDDMKRMILSGSVGNKFRGCIEILMPNRIREIITKNHLDYYAANISEYLRPDGTLA